MSKWLQLMDTAQAAEYLGIPAGTLEQWRSRGGGPVYLKMGLRVRYEKDALDKWVTGHRRTRTNESSLTAIAV
jgi:excisionase family DNA binding protein